MRLRRKFFNRKTLPVARDLLGKYLVRKIGRKIIRAKIIETEAYIGQNDSASHASKGLTPRTEVMFGPAGFSYVYIVYGMYYCLNIVTESKGYPAAVLIRAVDLRGCNGPGKVCRELKIDRKLNRVDLTKSRKIWIEENEEAIKPSQIKKGKRIGVDYAGPWKNKLWRFILSGI